MNVTELKEAILEIVNPKSKRESARLKHMYNGSVKYHSMFNMMKKLDVNDQKAIRQFWHEYNIKEAKLERWYKEQEVKHKSSVHIYNDFSDLAYNNSSDDL